MWHGQQLQDCFVHALLQEKKAGYFIDLAANDAIALSNTRTLERDHGWRGLCIEPNPQYHAGLLEYCTCNVVAAAVSDQVEEAWFDFRGTTLLKWLGRKSSYTAGVFGHVSNHNASGSSHVWLVPIGHILEKHAAPSTIYFMSLDVEGHEYKVMLSLIHI